MPVRCCDLLGMRTTAQGEKLNGKKRLNDLLFNK